MCYLVAGHEDDDNKDKNNHIYLSSGTLFKLRNTEIMLSTAYSAVPNFAELWCFSKRMEKIHNNICA